MTEEKPEVKVQWKGFTATILTGESVHELILEREVWREQEVQHERFRIPAGDIEDLMELLPAVLNLYRLR